MRQNEAWRVARRGRGVGRGGDDDVTGLHGLEGADIKLLGTEFQVRSQEEENNLCSEVGHCGL